MATVFLGSACEQWVNGECFSALTKAKRSLWVRPEKYKRDLVLFANEEAEKGNLPELIIESKVIYSSESMATQHRRLMDLARQLQASRRMFPQAQAVGIVTRFDYAYRIKGEKKRRRPRDRRRLRSREAGLLRTSRTLHLENAFKQSARRVRKRKVIVSLGRYQYEVTVSMEIVRLRV
ncbi:MAG TPA: hypothetical protein VGM88_32635 [Kofleriaceae bacterium]